MAPGYKADKYVTNNGPRGNGYSYQYDKKTGKGGILYDDGYFEPASDEKQPGYQPPKDEPSYSGPKATGPSNYDRAVDGVADAFGNALGDAAKMTGETILVLIAGLISIAAYKTFKGETSKNPGDIDGATAKALRTIACGIGIVVDMIAILICAIIFGSMASPVAQVVACIVTWIGLYTVWGLIRVARGKHFLIDPVAGFRKGFRKIRTTKVPKIAYVGIELLVTVLMTKPVLNWINSFTLEWARENQNAASDSLVIVLGIAMLACSIIIAAIIGLIVCKLVKAITAK